MDDTIGFKNSRHFFIQSEVKPEPIVTRLHSFSRASRQLQVITLSFDWFTAVCDVPDAFVVFHVLKQFGHTILRFRPRTEFRLNDWLRMEKIDTDYKRRTWKI